MAAALPPGERFGREAQVGRGHGDVERLVGGEAIVHAIQLVVSFAIATVLFAALKLDRE